MSDSSLDEERLVRYLTGDLSAEEMAQMEHWLAATPDQEQVVHTLLTARHAVQVQGRKELANDVAKLRNDLEAWARVQTAYAGRTAFSSPMEYRTADPSEPDTTFRRDRYPGYTGPVSTRFSGKMWTLFTAVALCIAAFGLTHWYQGRAATSVPAALASVYTTPNGQRATLSLPDGSFVVLNVGSRLEVPATYGAGNRQVRLVGEAMFTVTHQDETPFTVVAGSSTTRVLGTVFVVRKYTTDSVANIAVREGKVAVQSSVLTAHEQAVVTEDGAVSLSTATPSRFDFVHGTLTLEHMLLSDALLELGRWYDVDIRIGDPVLLGQRIGGKFISGSRAELATILESVLGFRVVQNGRTLTLYQE